MSHAFAQVLLRPWYAGFQGWRCHSGFGGPAFASGATLRVGLRDEPFSASTLSLSTLVSTWAVPPEADPPGLYFTAPASVRAVCSTLGLSAVENKPRPGSNGDPGRERELRNQNIFVHPVALKGLSGKYLFVKLVTYVGEWS